MFKIKNFCKIISACDDCSALSTLNVFTDNRLEFLNVKNQAHSQNLVFLNQSEILLKNSINP